MKSIYLLHHARRNNEFDPAHEENGIIQLGIAIQILYIFAPIDKIQWIIHGTGARFKEIADVMMKNEKLNGVRVSFDKILGTPEAVIHQEGREFVRKEDNSIVPRERYKLPSDFKNAKYESWKWMRGIEKQMEDDTSTILCTGRQFLLMLGLTAETIRGGCLFKIQSVEEKIVDRLAEYPQGKVHVMP